MHIKNRSDLDEFPDGGRATLVRRYSPPLNHRQLDILRTCRYDTPRRLEGYEYRCARELDKFGLMERDPSAPAVFRCTAAGEEVIERWMNAGIVERLKPL